MAGQWIKLKYYQLYVMPFVANQDRSLLGTQSSAVVRSLYSQKSFGDDRSFVLSEGSLAEQRDRRQKSKERER